MRAIEEIFGPDIALCYSIKANPFLLHAMSSVTARLEVCSPGELSICEQLHAADARVIYSGVNKTPVDIVRAVADGVGSYTAESLLQVRYLQEAALAAGKHLPVLLRLNAGSQFGMSKTDLFHALAHRAETPDLEFIGIHYFVGTQRKSWRISKKELAMLRELYDEIEQTFGLRLSDWNTAPACRCLILTATISPTPSPRPKRWPLPCREAARWAHLTVEMGRFYTAECGYYLTTAMDCKDHDGQALLHCGRRHEPPELHLGQIMGMKRPHLRHFAAQAGDAGLDPLRQPVYHQRVLVRSMPLDGLAPGDLLVFENAGAYLRHRGVGAVSQPRPAAGRFVVEDGMPRLVRGITPTYPQHAELIDKKGEIHHGTFTGNFERDQRGRGLFHLHHPNRRRHP